MLNGNRAMVTISALRDFFVAKNASEIEKAIQLLRDSTEESLPVSGDFGELEYVFNRVFVGPKSVPAPPFASVYIDPEHQVMGLSTARVLKIYKLLGLSPPQEEAFPPDHVSTELDAVIHFKNIPPEKYSKDLKAIWKYFLHDHLAVWIPQFIDRVMAEKQLPAEFYAVMRQLGAWLDAEIAADIEADQINSTEKQEVGPYE